MARGRKFVNGGANMEGNLPLLQTWYYEKWRYVDDLLRPFNPPLVGTSVKPKTDGQDKALNGRVLADLKEVASILREANLDKQLVVTDDIVLLQRHLQCLTMTDGGEDDKWLGDEVVDAVIEIMRHDHPKDNRDGQLVYIERVAGVAMLETDGKVFLPTNSVNTHWFLVVVNPKRREIQILDSLFSFVVRTQVVYVEESVERIAVKMKQDLNDIHKLLKEADDIQGALSLERQMHSKAMTSLETFQVVDAAIQIMRHDEPIDTRDGQLVYIERVAGVAKLERDGRIEKCYEDALAGIPGTTQVTSYLKHDMVFLPTRSLKVHWFLVDVNPRRKEIQAYIHKFRRDVPVVLVGSPYKKMKYRKRFKQYHARLPDATAVEDDEDAKS
ncbi:hypothetical protein D1007_59540 [Hordeum vulgare]|nr:hypothetical protein D1007_59540 [Hordeum vulgare]